MPAAHFTMEKATVDTTKPAVPNVWVATQTWVAKGLKMGRAEVIQICQNKLFYFHLSCSFKS